MLLFARDFLTVLDCIQSADVQLRNLLLVLQRLRKSLPMVSSYPRRHSRWRG